MMPIPIRRQSDALDRLLAGYVLANRVNDMVAKPTSKRYRSYRDLITRQYAGEEILDPNDQYREKLRGSVDRALTRLELRDGARFQRNQLYRHRSPRVHIAALPDAVEPPVCGYTVHVRKTLKSFRQAVKHGITQPMENHAQAMMLITGMAHWVHVNSWEDEKEGRAKINDQHVSDFNRRHAIELEVQMMMFLLATRRVYSSFLDLDNEISTCG